MSDEIGEHQPCKYRGWLVFASLPMDLQNAEDSTLAADHERGMARHGRPYIREATAAERTLLAHLGHTVPPDLRTRVRWLTSGVRERTWPALIETNAQTVSGPSNTHNHAVTVYLGGSSDGLI